MYKTISFLTEFLQAQGPKSDGLINAREVLYSLEQEDPYTFYPLYTAQDCYAILQRIIFHIALCGFWVGAPSVTVGPGKGRCPRCLKPCKPGQIAQGTEKADGYICPDCKIFIFTPRPVIVQLCPLCQNQMAKEPTGMRCPFCDPLSKANQQPKPSPTLPRIPRPGYDGPPCLRCGELTRRSGNCYICDCGETSSCG